MGGSLLGFHPPHFSEDDAWLPAWLQPPSTIRDQQPFQSPEAPQALEEIGRLQQNIGTRENGTLSDDGRCKSFHLFLSGEDNSHMTFPSCSSNHEVPYQLRLSTNEESQYSLNPILSRSQAEIFEFNEALLVRQSDAKVISEDTRDKDSIIPSRQRDNLGESVSFKEKKGINPKADARSRKVNIKDAIELAVAASEALIIHEVLKDDGPISVASSVVLEAAIRVKQACLEELKETLSSSIEESNEIDFDFCSNLDELTMADAYEDVGLTVANNHGYLSAYGSISHVKDSFASESYISNTKQKCKEPDGLEVDSLKQQHKQVYKEHVEYEALGIETADLACDIDPMFSCSVEQAGLCMTEVGLQREDFAIGDLSSTKTIFRSSIHHGSSGYNEREEDKMTNLVPERFQSRWFGGWTWKNEANIPTVTDDKYKRSIPEVFANEASSLSESADIAPDQNSCIQRQDKECKTISQSSIALEHTYEKASNCGNFLSADVAISPSIDPECTYDKVISGNLLSDDVAATPGMSLLDPLCSVVPCSFNSNSVVSQNCEQQVNLEKNLGPMTEPNLDNNLAKTASPQSEGKSISEVNGEVRRKHVTSLKTYGMLYPRCDPYLDKERTRGESLPCEYAPTVVPSVMQTPALDNNDGHDQTTKDNSSHSDKDMNLPMTINKCKSYLVPGRKRVRFCEAEVSYPKVKKFKKPQARLKDPFVVNRICSRLRSCNLQPKSRANEVERCSVTDKKMLFQDLKFLLTGFSVKKHKQIKNLIQKNGGVVFDDIPSPSTYKGKRGSKYKSQLLPLILCPRRLLTTKFLYGCAVNACILKVNWLFDSLDDGSILPPKKYIVLKEHDRESCTVIEKLVNDTCCIFDNMAIMLHGKPDFYTKMAKVIKHGGGSVFKSFCWLVKSLESKRVSVGAIVLEDENVISRQLKQCALEQKIPMISFNWIINSLYAGRLLPSPELEFSCASMGSKLPMELSEEI